MFRLLLPLSLCAFSILHAKAQDAANLSVGQRAPDFRVTDSNGKSLELSARTKAGKNVVLMFSRAHW